MTVIRPIWQTFGGQILHMAKRVKQCSIAIYPPELLELFPDKNFEKSKVKEWFKATAKLGDSAANKATSLFTLLKRGEIKSASGSAQSPAKKTKSEKKTPTQKVHDMIPLK